MRFFDWLFGRSGRDSVKTKETDSPITAYQPDSKLDEKPVYEVPQRRLKGPFEAVAEMPPESKWSSHPVRWDTYLASEEYLNARRSLRHDLPDWGHLVEISPSGKSAVTFAETAIHDFISDFEEFQQNRSDADHEAYFSQSIKLKKANAKIAVMHCYDDRNPVTIGHLPTSTAETIARLNGKVGSLAVEIVEARVCTSSEKPLARYSINILTPR